MRERLLFGYGFKDTEPWPVFAQQLGIPASTKGAFWMIVGNGMDATGRDWSTAWLAPPSLGFQIYAMEARGDETAEDVTQAKVQAFVDRFLKQVGGGGEREEKNSQSATGHRRGGQERSEDRRGQMMTAHMTTHRSDTQSTRRQDTQPAGLPLLLSS